jgi:hypothetical protein
MRIETCAMRSADPGAARRARRQAIDGYEDRKMCLFHVMACFIPARGDRKWPAGGMT